ncbi:uncharacterized protein LOC100177513 [Ciona intestinalis]
MKSEATELNCREPEKFGCIYKLTHNMRLDSLACCNPQERRFLGDDMSHLSSEQKDVEVPRSLQLSSEERDRKGMCGPIPWSILPILLSITSCIGFTSTYFFAKNNCHTERWIFPYLSYTGTEHPESMIFGLILNIEGFFGMTIVFLAWRYFRHMGQRGALNRVTIVFGMLSCFGVILVGNFQVSKAKVPHYTGAGLAFIVGTLYGVTSCILCRRALRSADPPMRFAGCIIAARLATAVVMVSAVICLTCIGIYKKMTNGVGTSEYIRNMSLIMPNGTCQELLQLIPTHVKVIDLFGSLTEWLLTLCVLVCLSLFAYEFKAFKSVKVTLLTPNGPMHTNNNCCQKKTHQTITPPIHSPDDGTQMLLPPCGVPERRIRETSNSRVDVCDNVNSNSSISFQLITLSRSLPNLPNAS